MMDRLEVEMNTRSKDLMYFGILDPIAVVVDNVHELLTTDGQLFSDMENYLLQVNKCVIHSQPMARTKQTARKTTADGTLQPSTTTGNTRSTPATPLQSPGG